MAGKYNISIDQGSTFTFQFTMQDGSGTPWNLTSYSARMQIRTATEASSALASLTTGSGITLQPGGVQGVVAVTISAAQTAAMPAGRHVWDIELVSAGNVVTRVLEGKAAVKAEVTR